MAYTEKWRDVLAWDREQRGLPHDRRALDELAAAHADHTCKDYRCSHSVQVIEPCDACRIMVASQAHLRPRA